MKNVEKEEGNPALYMNVLYVVYTHICRYIHLYVEVRICYVYTHICRYIILYAEVCICVYMLCV
jgi:hypothetical protein